MADLDVVADVVAGKGLAWMWSPTRGTCMDVFVLAAGKDVGNRSCAAHLIYEEEMGERNTTSDNLRAVDSGLVRKGDAVMAP